MTKQELIKHQIVCQDVVIKQAESAIQGLQVQLAEAEKLEKLDKFLEKPKLGHGDFGITDSPYVVVSQPNCIMGSPKAIFADGGGQDNADKVISSDTRLGNVFDLMKGWDKPFEDYKKNIDCDNRTFIIEKSNWTQRDLWIGVKNNNVPTERMGVQIKTSEAEEIHNALGHAIAELKQKKEISGKK